MPTGDTLPTSKSWSIIVISFSLRQKYNIAKGETPNPFRPGRTFSTLSVEILYLVRMSLGGAMLVV